MPIGRRLLLSFVSLGLIAAVPVIGLLPVSAAPIRHPKPVSDTAATPRSGTASLTMPFRPLTPQERNAAKGRILRRGGSAAPDRVGPANAGGAAVAPRGTVAVPLRARSLQSHHSPLLPPPTAPDQLAGFAGIAQATTINSFGSDQEVTPPNEDVAAGPTDIVEVVNSTVEIFNRSGGDLGLADLNTFLDVSPGYHSSDPRIIYDAAGGRFWITITEVPDRYSSPTNCPASAPVLIAVSGSSNPLPFTTWTVYALPMEAFPNSQNPSQAPTEFGDQPGLGIASNTVAVTFDDFTCANQFNGSEVDILQKTDFEHDSGANNSVDFFDDGPFAPQPVQSIGSVSVQYVISNQSDCAGNGCASGSPAAEVDKFTGTPEGSGVPLPTVTYVPMQATAVDDSTGFLPPADQPSTGLQLQTNDDRFLNAVWENDDLWATDGTSCQPSGDTVQRDCLNYVEISASSIGSGTPTMLNQMNGIGLNGVDYFYPAVSLDSSGDAVTVFDESSTTIMPSIVDAAIVNGGTELTSFQTLHTSSTYTTATTSSPAPATVTAAAGATTLAPPQDPSNPKDVWVVSGSEDGSVEGPCNTSSGGDCWNTQIDDITLAGPIITSMTPSSGPVAGGQTVVVRGVDFGSDTTATWWSGAALSLINLNPTSFSFITPPAAQQPEIAPLVAIDDRGSTIGQSNANFTYVGLANYVPVTPFRLLDTRKTGGPLGRGAIRAVQVTDLGASPIPTSATAVVVNVTEVSGTSSSLLTVYPYGTSRPNASNLNFAARTVIANLVTVTLGGFNGEEWINIYNALGTVNVLVDVEGYFTPEASSDVTGLFHPIAPIRVCDTRSPSPTPICSAHHALGAGASMVVNFSTAGGLPSDGSAEAAVVNLTGVAGTALTYLSLFPTNSHGGCTATGTSTINLASGAVEANRVMVALGPSTTGGVDDSLCVFNAAGTINLLIDANGWFGSSSAPASPAGYQYQALAPTRICDTRVASLSCATGAIPPSRLISVAGHAGVPAFSSPTVVVAIIANLTAVAPSATTYLTVWPAGIAKPNVSDLNVNVGEVLPNLAIVELDTIGADPNDGDLFLYNSVGSVNAIIDIEGWFQ